MTTIIKAQQPTDMLAMMPHLLGYAPSESLVYVAFRGNRTMGALRLDLEPAAADHRHALGMLGKLDGIDGVFVAAYTGSEVVESLQESLVRLEALATISGLHVKGALVVGPIAVHDALTGDVYPVAEVAMSQVAALAESLPAVAASVMEGTELPEVPARIVAAMAKPNRTDVPRYLKAGRLLDMLDVLLDGQEAETPCLQLVEAALSSPVLHDVAIATWVRGVEFGERAAKQQEVYQLTGAFGSDDPDAANLLTGAGSRPDAARLKAIIPVLARTAASLPADRAVPSMAVLGWLEWALGSSTRAQVWFERALAADPAYGFASLMAQVIEAGLLPQWAFDTSGTPESADEYLN